MPIAYLANAFPEPLESYVGEEIHELRKQGCQVLPCSVRRPRDFSRVQTRHTIDTRYVFPLRLWPSVKASWRCILRLDRIADIVWRAVRGPEPISRRCRTLAHTWLGAYLAVLLKRGRIQHLHVHHGYFASWVGMVTARLLGASFSMTLHGSDLLVRADYLDAKFKNCRFCITVSEFNRQYIVENYPQIDLDKILVQRLGVDMALWPPLKDDRSGDPFTILSVGRLHPTKNYGFLLLACAALKARGVPFRCVIAGEGEEHRRLEQLIAALGIGEEVTLRGYVPREGLPELYASADVVALTSRSEGIPVTLMEAMAMGRVVLAPNITGIPELVANGQTGFLFQPNSMEDFLAKLQLIRVAGPSLDAMRRAARRQVDLYFNSRVNLAGFAERFLKHAGGYEQFAPELPRNETNENPVLQQVQLRVQRDRSLPV